MPIFTYSQAMTASQQGLNPLSGWQYEFAPYPAAVKVIINATTAGVRATIYTGSQTIQQRAPVGSGGTAGVMPNELSNPAITFVAAQGDRLMILLDEVLAGTPTVNLVVYIEPLV